MVTIFEQGDIIYLDFDPQAGHEQKGRRPAIVVSNNTYNRFSKTPYVCPITHTNKQHPFHVELDNRTKTDGVVLCDQTKALDLDARKAKFVERAPDDVIAEIVDSVISFIEIVD